MHAMFLLLAVVVLSQHNVDLDQNGLRIHLVDFC